MEIQNLIFSNFYVLIIIVFIFIGIVINLITSTAKKTGEVAIDGVKSTFSIIFSGIKIFFKVIYDIFNILFLFTALTLAYMFRKK